MKFVKIINPDSNYYGYIFRVLGENLYSYELEIPKHIPEYRGINSLFFEFWEVE